MSDNSDIQKHIIPESELKKITDAVHQGIVMGKQSDSNFWGEQLKFNRRIEEKIDSHVDEHKIQVSEQKNFMKKIEPILQKYNDIESTKRTLVPWGKRIIFAGGVLGGWQILKSWLGIHN